MVTQVGHLPVISRAVISPLRWVRTDSMYNDRRGTTIVAVSLDVFVVFSVAKGTMWVFSRQLKETS